MRIPVRSRARIGLMVDLLAALFVVLLFWLLAGRLLQVRTPEHGDQASYLELAANIRSGDGFVTKRLSPFYPRREITHPESVRQPLLPLLLSLSATRDFEFFLRARWWVWCISLMTLITLYIFISRIWGKPAAFVSSALLGLNVHFHTFSTEIWCENLLILWTTLAGFAVHEFFRSEQWKPLYRRLFYAGVLTALGYYTKASAAALLVTFCIFCAFRLGRAIHARYPNDKIFSWCIAPAVGYLLLFVILLSPYVVFNLATTGTLLRNQDLQAAFWVSDGADFYLPHSAPPSPFRLLHEQPWHHVPLRILNGLLRQAGNHLDALKIAPFGESYFVAGMIWLLALGSLFRYRDSSWRGYLILLLLFNAAVAVWYVVVDVTPRFIYIGVPFLYLHAALGLVSSLRWCVEKFNWKNTFLERIQLLNYILPVLFLLLTLWQQHEALNPRPLPLHESERVMIYYLKDRIEPDAVLLMGPTHQLPWNYIFDKRYIFVPIYDEWEPVLAYVDFFGAKYFLLDQELYHRRIALFQPFVSWERGRGLSLQHPIPRMDPIYMDNAFILFRILPPSETASH